MCCSNWIFQKHVNIGAVFWATVHHMEPCNIVHPELPKLLFPIPNMPIFSYNLSSHFELAHVLLHPLSCTYSQVTTIFFSLILVVHVNIWINKKCTSNQYRCDNVVFFFFLNVGVSLQLAHAQYNHACICVFLNWSNYLWLPQAPGKQGVGVTSVGTLW